MNGSVDARGWMIVGIASLNDNDWVCTFLMLLLDGTSASNCQEHVMMCYLFGGLGRSRIVVVVV